MKLVFVWTGDTAPAVSTVNNVVKIEQISEGGTTTIRVTTGSGTVLTFNKADGQLSILWE